MIKNYEIIIRSTEEDVQWLLDFMEECFRDIS